MPELPEVEAIRRTLAPELIGASIHRVRIQRRDVVRDRTGRRRGRLDPVHLGDGLRIDRVDRRGKQLILGFENGSGLVLRLGMSGRVDLWSGRIGRTPPHRHAVWVLQSDHRSERRLAFVDPRRFGGIHLYGSSSDLEDRLLGGLGPEATSIDSRELQARLGRTTRAIKIALLDQSLIAGLGNIYVDEALHRARINPTGRADRLDSPRIVDLARCVRTILRRAIDAGGSTLRDHRLPSGEEGGYRDAHQVYGRGTSPCPRCGTSLIEIRLAARSTTFCPSCQPL
ncbi:MAG: bifunctional DNA-formamidopyrimidine glycosylase/DNA-(apurinic or apyrimidinic site) lyase [Planctomycetota bacterium]|nr:bifunctional DNA-formamidopyrimidine glycosylase/DNA-(apurinic or apyrimidinic site) lyase [Planctomycetota bacterium]